MESLGEIFRVFLRLGTFGFGGPIAAMAMMEEELCGRRAWLKTSEFNEIYTVCKVLPGPVATQTAIFLGRRRAGTPGGIVAGVAFILPAFLIVLGLSFGYAQMGWVEGLKETLQGMQITALAVVAASAWHLSRAHRRSALAWVLAAVSTAVVVARPDLEVALILGFGLMGAALARGLPRSAAWAFFTLPVAGAPALSFFWTCFKAGFVVFGSGLAIIPLLEHEVVATHGWITHAQFMDGLVIGQVTPGPVLITTTFIGFLLGGFPGACLATVGTFLPGFIIVLGILPRVWDRLAGTPWVAGFTRWAIPAVIGGILGVTIRLGRVAFLGGYAPWPLYAVFGLGLFAAFSRKIPAWLLIPAGGVGMYVFNALSQIYFF